MIERISNPIEKTLGEFIAANYPDFKIRNGSAALDMDISHGIEVEVHDNSKFGYGILAELYPYILWTDGLYKPCHYWSDEHFLILEKGGRS